MKSPVKIVILALLSMGLLSGCVGAVVVQPEVKLDLVWSESFEDGTVGEPPSGWELQRDYDPGYGPRVVDSSVVSIIDGQKALKIYEEGSAVRVRHEFGPIEKGRVELYVYAFALDEDERGQAEIDLFSGSKRALSILLLRDAELRYRDEKNTSTQAAGGKLTLERGAWHKLAIEWNAEARVFHAFYYNAAGKAVRFTPAEGVPFDAAAEGAPDTLRLGITAAGDGSARAAYFDAIEVFTFPE